jgi:hypothetical protein
MNHQVRVHQLPTGFRNFNPCQHSMTLSFSMSRYGSGAWIVLIEKLSVMLC